MLVKPKIHNRVLLRMIDRLMTRADMSVAELDLLVCGTGPGAFMGVRIAVAAAQGLSYATDIPLMPLSSLYALAQRGRHLVGRTSSHGQERPRGIMPTLDARLGQLYWGYYAERNGRLQELVAPRLSAPQDVENCVDLALGLGDGWKYRDKMSSSLSRFSQVYAEEMPQARYLIEVAREQEEPLLVPPQELKPIYLRDHRGNAQA